MSDLTDHEPAVKESRKAKNARLAEQVTALRPGYQADLAEGTDRFFEPRMTSCPWCESTQLRQRLRTTDLFQHKPGDFTLDICADCRHVFQNPRLSEAGLEFYYRDFYDGLGEERLDNLFESTNAAYAGRTKLVTDHVDAPKEWLDVGTGHGHFPRSAAESLPATEFDGIDLSEGVELGKQHGWLRRGWRGQFTELADTLADGYDVVSMCHYLEHTPEPKQELAAAAKVVRPGGHLLIEVPDPECRFGTILGRWWLPWLQPQHLNFVPIGNLKKELEALGFTILGEQRAEPHGAIDVLAAAWLLTNKTAPHGDGPWFAQSPSALRGLVRKIVLLAGLPLMVLGHLADVILHRFADRLRLTNAYRVVARRT